jgi:hypothetical protein
MQLPVVHSDSNHHTHLDCIRRCCYCCYCCCCCSAAPGRHNASGCQPHALLALFRTHSRVNLPWILSGAAAAAAAAPAGLSASP